MSYYVHDIDPMAISYGWLILPWYWLAYIAGFFIVYFGFFNLIKKGRITLSPKFVHGFLSKGFLYLIFGGRVGYILFYNLSYYISNPSKIFAVWEGGMSFHGAVLAVTFYAIYSSRKEKISIFQLTDPISLWAPLGIFFGRLANFMNGELAGRATDVSWAVIFPKFYDQTPRHPSQIYEAVSEGIVVFLIIQIFGLKRIDRRGLCSGLFLSLYGLGRFIVEFFRNPDPQIGLFFGLLTLGQLFCLAMIIIGSMIIARSLKTSPKEI
jgi:phosphatidylglycerol:prolipoprotein diacylglycerol transferase